MTMLEKRVRSGLEAEARAIGVAKRVPRHAHRSGIAIAVATAALVLVVFGGVSILTGAGEDVALDSTPSTPDPTVEPGGPFQAVPFTGDTWQFTVSEGANPSSGTYKVCHRFDPPGVTTDASAIGTSGCDTWPTDDPGYLVGVERALWTDTGVVLLVDLTHNPVDRVTITGAGVDEAITPYALPGSGKQFAVVEVPDTSAGLTVEAVDASGSVLDRVAGVDVSTATRVAGIMGGESLEQERLEFLTGMPSDMADSGYLIDSTTTDDDAYELGLIVFEEDFPTEDPPLTCFSDYAYAINEGVTVVGGAICGDRPQQVADLAAFHLSGGGSCGPIPKEDPVVNGIWTILTVWGVPETAGSVTVGLGDGTTLEVEAPNGVALHLWEESVDITSITFDGMTQPQRDLVASYMPMKGIGDTCGRSSGPG